MIRFSNGHSFEYMASSGALGFDGAGWQWEQPLRWLGYLNPRLFTIVTKTITRYTEKGNYQWYAPWRTVRFVKDGVLNAIGLTNPGLDKFLEMVLPILYKNELNLIVSIDSQCKIAEERNRELCGMAEILDRHPFNGIELNASCPNSLRHKIFNGREVIEVCKRIKDTSSLPLIVKVSIQHDYENIAYYTQDVVEAISINSIPWRYLYPDPDIESPLKRFGGGGVSGRAAQRLTWEMAKDLVAASKTPVIGPGVWEYEDIDKLFAMGVEAVSFGSIFLRYPWRPSRFVRRHIKEKGLGI